MQKTRIHHVVTCKCKNNDVVIVEAKWPSREKWWCLPFYFYLANELLKAVKRSSSLSTIKRSEQITRMHGGPMMTTLLILWLTEHVMRRPFFDLYFHKSASICFQYCLSYKITFQAKSWICVFKLFWTRQALNK